MGQPHPLTPHLPTFRILSAELGRTPFRDLNTGGFPFATLSSLSFWYFFSNASSSATTVGDTIVLLYLFPHVDFASITTSVALMPLSTRLLAAPRLL